jgi:hypothetical protein
VIVLATPLRCDIGNAVTCARAKQLRTVHLDSMTVAALQTIAFVSPVVVVGCRSARAIV